MNIIEEINQAELSHKNKIEVLHEKHGELIDKGAPNGQIQAVNEELIKFQTSRPVFLKAIDKTHLKKALKMVEELESGRKKINDAINGLELVDTGDMSVTIEALTSKLHEYFADAALGNQTDKKEQESIEKRISELNKQLTSSTNKNTGIQRTKAVLVSKLTLLNAEINEANKAIETAKKHYAFNRAEVAAKTYAESAKKLIENYESMLSFQQIVGFKSAYDLLTIPSFIGLEALAEFNSARNKCLVYDGQRATLEKTAENTKKLRDELFS